MSRKRFLLLVTLILMILLWLPTLSPAQITPSKHFFEAHLAAGETQEFSFKVFNLDKKKSTTANIYLRDWDLESSGSTQYLEPGSLPRSCANWIALDREQVEIEPDSSIEISFSLDVPKGSKGSYWTMIFVEPTTETPTEEAPESETGRVVGIRSVMRYAIPIYQTVPGTEKRKLQITKLDVERNNGGLPLNLIVESENLGNTILRDVSGSVELKDRTGKTVGKLDIPEFMILPGGTRKFSLKYNQPLDPGVYIALASIDYGGRALVAAQRGFLVKG